MARDRLAAVSVPPVVDKRLLVLLDDVRGRTRAPLGSARELDEQPRREQLNTLLYGFELVAFEILVVWPQLIEDLAVERTCRIVPMDLVAPGQSQRRQRRRPARARLARGEQGSCGGHGRARSPRASRATAGSFL